MNKMFLLFPFLFIFLPAVQSCKQKNTSPSKELVNEINLKRGQVISCGPPDKQFGSVEFQMTCSEEVKEDFNLAIKLLHSFEYDEAEKVFANVIDKEPECAMAYWGVAMSNFHPLWTPPTEVELKKGAKAIQIALSLQKSKREAAYIAAIASFYMDWEVADHRTRCLKFEKGMETVYTNYPDDKEAAIFYALALNAAADPNDKSFIKQKKAGSILGALHPNEPNHPGIVHYLIHTYDYPELAQQGLPAARKYASIAPSSAHALHMPSHIFTRLGLWDECITSNVASVSSAQCYAEAAGIKGHWDEELHGLDYLVYAYLQKGENDSAKRQWDYLKTITEIYPVNFKVAYAYAAIPSRFVLENRMWQDAANLKVFPENFPWNNFPWQEAIVHFTRSIGSVHTNNLTAARDELKVLKRIYNTLVYQKDSYKANQVAIQMKTAEAWIRMKEGKNSEAFALMQLAADMEDKTEKHPVTPGEVIPAREFLGDMLLQLNQPAKALEAYEANLKKHPNRFNALYGAGLAAEKAGNVQKARLYFQHLVNVAGNAQSNRAEVIKSRQYLDGLSAL
jgi:tetratricopeptide (TPR) repeat protein